MKVCIVGNGKLSQSLYNGLQQNHNPIHWDEVNLHDGERMIVIHVGSGRQFEDCLEYCNTTGSVLLELSTGNDLSQYTVACPIVICPNTAIPVLKMMTIIKHSGRSFSEYTLRILESHQKSKTTVAGTAVELAKALGCDPQSIEAIRDPEKQLAIGIPKEHLNLHAYHNITIENAGCKISVEMKVVGHEAYVHGVSHILNLIHKKEFQNIQYHILEIL